MLENFQVNDYKFKDYLTMNDNLLYLDYINNNYDFTEINISPDIAYRYQGNFFGLLRELSAVETSLYLYTLYLNDLVNPTDFDGKNKLTIKIPIRPQIPVD